MSLYKDASLVMIPSAYKDGKLYSIRPTDGSGDFTFSRGSNLAATRVDVNGLIEKGRENLFLRSNEFNLTWNTYNTSRTSGAADFDGGNNAWTLAKTGSYGLINQYIANTGVHTFSIYVKAGSLNWVALTTSQAPFSAAYFDLTNGVVGSLVNAIDSNIESVGGGWYRCSLTSNVTAAGNWRIYPADSDGGLSNSNLGDIIIYKSQLEAGLVATDYIETGASTAQAGILEDMPRLDYSGGASCPALLLEPQRTNLVPHSENFNDWVKQSGVSVVQNTTETLSPEGKYNAAKITGNGTLGVLKSNLGSAATNTKSVYLKGVSGGESVVLKDPNQTIGTTTCNLTTEWQRFDLTDTQTGSYGIWIDDIPSGGIYAWGAQVEVGSYPTSYIPTYGASVTRSNDSQSQLSVPDGNSSQGTIFYEFDKAQAPASYDIVPLKVGTNRILRISQYNPNMRFSINENATSYDESNSYNSHIKVAVSYSSSSVKLFINGVLRATDTTYSASGNVVIPANGLQATNIGCSLESKQLTYFPTALTDSECIALTS